MDIEKLLTKIEKESKYMLLGGCYCLQVDVAFNFFRVIPIEDVYQESFVDFSTGIINSFVTIGISMDQEELWRLKTEIVDNGQKNFIGNIFVDERYRVIEGEPTLNLIKINKPITMYEHNLTLYRMGVNRNWLLLGIAASPKIAKMHIQTVRTLGGRAENPKKTKT